MTRKRDKITLRNEVIQAAKSATVSGDGITTLGLLLLASPERACDFSGGAKLRHWSLVAGGR